MDKLILHIPTENFRKNSNFNDNFNCKPAEYSLKNGLIIKPEKYYLNTELINYDISEIGLRLLFNPNKVASIKQFDVLKYNQFQNSIDFVAEQSKKVGLNYDIETAKIYRYDNNFDIATDFNYNQYQNVFHNLHCSIRNSRSNKQVDTFYYKNKSNEICIYDKTAENIKNKVETLPNNMRFETRRLKLYKNKKMYISDISPIKFNQLRISDKDYILKNLFDKNIEVIRTEIETIIRNNFQSDNNINEISNKTLIEIALLYFTVEELIEMIKIYEARSNNKKYQRNYQFIKINIKDKVYLQQQCLNLYTEIKEKLIKVA